MRRAFTLQLYDNGDVHAHVCHDCRTTWECRLDCTIEWRATDKEYLGADMLDLGAETLCAKCQELFGDADPHPCPPTHYQCRSAMVELEVDVKVEEHVIDLLGNGRFG